MQQFYNPQAQGFNNAGGQPPAQPTQPAPTYTPLVQQNINNLLSAGYSYLTSRQSAFTNYIASAFTANGYNNEFTTKFLTLIGDLIDFRMNGTGLQLNQVVPECVSAILNKQMFDIYNSAGGQFPVYVSPEDLTHMQAANSYIASIRNQLAQINNARNAPPPVNIFNQPSPQQYAMNGYVQPQYQQQQQYPQQQMMSQGFATNPVYGQVAQMRNNVNNLAMAFQGNQPMVPQQQPSLQQLHGSAGLDPMPQIDMERYNAVMNSATPTASQPAQGTTNRSQASHDPFDTQMQFSQKPVKEMSYEERVAAKFRDLGFDPNQASLSLMESEITRLDPNNGFIGKNNAYSEMKNFQNNVNVNPGAYKPSQADVDAVIKTNAGKGFAEVMKSVIGDNPINHTTTVVGSAQGSTPPPPPSFPGAVPNVNTSSSTETPPYPFAAKTLSGDWIIEGGHYPNIPKSHRGVFIYPAVFLDCYLPYYLIDNDGYIIDFITKERTKENAMEFQLHDDTRFFTPMSSKDQGDTTSTDDTISAFELLRNEQRVAEVIEDLETQAGVASGDDEALIINKSIILDEQVNGNYVGDDYYTVGIDALRHEMSESDIKFEAADIAVRYKHVHMYQWHAEGDELEVLLRLRNNNDYLSIAEVLEDLNDLDGVPGSWFTRLNDVATRFVNEQIENALGLPEDDKFYIRSFVLDIEDAIARLKELPGEYANAFKATAYNLTRSLFYVWTSDKVVFQEYFHTNDEEKLGSMGIIRDVTVLPIHSRQISLRTNDDNVCILTKQGFKNLWRVMKDRLDSKEDHVAEVVFVTTDNRRMYVRTGVNEDIILITQTSMFE